MLIRCEKNELNYRAKPEGIISESIVQNWTIQALDCYKIDCNCKICPIVKAHYSFKCKMKEIVQILLKTIGEPNENEILNMINRNNVA